MKGKSERTPKSLKKRLLTFFILCWAVPLTVFFTFTTISYSNGIVEKSERLMADELNTVASFASIRIGDAIALCQRPSYEKTWENAWKSYEAGNITKNQYLQQIYTSLRGKFYMDERFDMYAYYQRGEETPACFSSRAGIYQKSYELAIQPGLSNVVDIDSSYTYVRVVNGRIFIVRNLYTTVDYKRYGTLVVELNREKMFRDVPESIRQNMMVCIGNSEDVIDFVGTEPGSTKAALADEMLAKYDVMRDGTLDRVQNQEYNAYLYQERYDDYHIGVMVLAKRSELYSSLYELYTIIALMLLFFVPLLLYGVHFLQLQIQHPIEQILKTAKRMEEGEIGAKVEGDKMPNAEFSYMKESFDRMSAQVKYLFDYVYDEKLARKDAQIQALQAQINPHFLNNTLEMMNWQARMSGDAVVSKMIESLGTVLDYRMNRADVKEIHLAEELQCIDAYFYIMSMRFGQRLQIEREIDEDLLYIMVPPLILQPIVENAIVHGVETVKNGAIRLKVYHDEENVYLEVHNTGKKMTKEDKERIEAMLTGDVEKLPKHQGRHTSIGIQNVNRRIRLVYGEEYGLTIVQDETNETTSTITIPYHEKQGANLLKERNEVENELRNMARLNK